MAQDRETIRIDGNHIWRSALDATAALLRRCGPTRKRLAYLESLPRPDLEPWPQAGQPSPGRPAGAVSDPTHRRAEQITAERERWAAREAEMDSLRAQLAPIDAAIDTLPELQQDLIRLSVVPASNSMLWRSPGGIGLEHGVAQGAAYRQRTIALYRLAVLLLQPEEVFAEEDDAAES